MINLQSSKYRNLQNLQRWLNYELSSSVLLFLWWFGSLAGFLMVAAAIIFTPFMLFVLYKERKFGWITTFILMISIPLSLNLITVKDPTFTFIKMLLPLASFYFYCFILRFSVNDWVSEERARNSWKNKIEPI
ncbi:MAG: hypothetical protein NTX22_14605 [Ignavibacteriales bacterium]|nr:hypothetical protein [Ignavibacteriales bacterium]